MILLIDDNDFKDKINILKEFIMKMTKQTI